MNLPENMVNFMIYREGSRLAGTGDIDLPSLDSMMEKVKGAGIAGEVEAPILGHYAALGMTINWRTIQAEAAALAEPLAHNIDMRGSQQVYDSASGKYSTVPVKVVVKATPKKTSLGKMVVAAQTGTKNEFEVSYILIYVDGEEILELDKYNFICRINGTDYLADVRSDLGLDS